MIMTLASIWLILTFVYCVYAWIAGSRWTALVLPVVSALVAYGLWMSTGTPRFTHPPKGKYTVEYGRVDVDQQIIILLNDGSGKLPTYYILPYSDKEANSLSDAMNEGGEGGTVKMEVKGGGEDGAMYSGEPPVKGNPPKE